MWKITTEKEFEAGHRLVDYEGKCRRIHGHNYRVLITICGNYLLPWGAVEDFGSIKNNLSKLLDEWDHKLLLKDCKENRKIFKGFKRDWIVWLKFNATAEEMARYLYKKINDWFITSDTWVDNVTIYETPTSCATYSEPTINYSKKRL